MNLKEPVGLIGTFPKLALLFHGDFLTIFTQIITKKLIGDLSRSFRFNWLVLFKFSLLRVFDEFMSKLHSLFSLLFIIDSGRSDPSSGCQFFHGIVKIKGSIMRRHDSVAHGKVDMGVGIDV